MKITHHDDLSEMGEALAEEIARDLKSSIEHGDRPLLLLPGGSSPIPLLKALKEKNLPWDAIQISTTDERCVPISDPQSNAGQVDRILGPLTHLSPLFKNDQIVDITSSSPLIAVLGMGTDGHIASLFPGQDWRENTTTPFLVQAPKNPKDRVTLPFHIFLQSRKLILLVCGTDKIALVEEVLKGQHTNLPVFRLLELAKNNLEIHMAS